jgi:hypothetical protein
MITSDIKLKNQLKLLKNNLKQLSKNTTEKKQQKPLKNPHKTRKKINTTLKNSENYCVFPKCGFVWQNTCVLHFSYKKTVFYFLTLIETQVTKK